MRESNSRKLLWWGRSDVNYSRNRIVRQLLKDLGWQIIDFSPVISDLADIEAYIRMLPTVDLVWVPCFRQRDIAAARRWSKRKSTPLVCDPLISAYDKQVWERAKFQQKSDKAKNLLKWEQTRLQSAELVIADTQQHANFFADVLEINPNQLAVLAVGAEEQLFFPQDKQQNSPLQILFFGSYIGLQGPEVITEAINLYDGPTVNWTLIGNGPLKSKVEQRLNGYSNVQMLDWVDYAELPNKIAQADLCLGIFGSSQKSLRVIPNKVYQALACARPVITCRSEAYPQALLNSSESGLFFTPAGDAKALADYVADLASKPYLLLRARQAAFNSYQDYFSNDALKKQLQSILTKVLNQSLPNKSRV